jgi:hypothetical protein
MTNITTQRLGDTAQVDRPQTEVEPGSPAATRTSRTDNDRRLHVSTLLAIGISVGAAALAVVAIATDDTGSDPAPSVTVPAGQPPNAQPPVVQPANGGVPDGVPCPDNPIRGRPAVC